MMTESLDFSEALIELRSGEQVARRGWNGQGVWIALQEPTELSMMRRPYLFMHPVDGELVPWIASQTDLLADDWYIL